MDEDSLGQRLRRLRQERGLSLARVVGADFSRAYLNQVELGKSQPSTRILRVIAARLGTQVEYLLDGSTPTLDREVALERARISLLRGHHRRCLAELEPALESSDWPLGADARLCAAEALLALERGEEAAEILAGVEVEVRSHRDALRLRRLQAVRRRRRFKLARATGVRELGEAYAGAGDALLRSGRSSAALEQYRRAQTLLEAAAILAEQPPAATRSAATGTEAASPSGAPPRA